MISLGIFINKPIDGFKNISDMFSFRIKMTFYNLVSI